ncbi:hypothetical protein OH787_40845 (plasmid) [Streptomyces sp. NBC_01547]|uniref:hypothetical protein n=1 Tax=Streptomyces sp. NBC_01547 TaxID=2975873 RepID=UPI002F90CBFF
MNHELLHGDLCPLYSRLLRPQFGHSRESRQQDGPARVWFEGYRCDDCEATRPQQFWDAMRARYEN